MMAKQSSFIKLEGTIGDVTFYKSRNGYKARQKGGISKDRILKDASFQRTRENLAEFARAAAGSKLLKDAFREITVKAKDPRTLNRVYSLAMKVLKTDLVNDRGQRTMEGGDLSLFTGFQFSSNATLEATIFASYGIQNDTEQVTVNFEAFVPQNYLSIPDGATDFRLFLVTTAVDFGSKETVSNSFVSPEYKIGPDLEENLSLSVSKTVLPNSHQFHALGIEFLQEVNGKLYSLNNGAYNSAKIILTEST